MTGVRKRVHVLLQGSQFSAISTLNAGKDLVSVACHSDTEGGLHILLRQAAALFECQSMVHEVLSVLFHLKFLQPLPYSAVR